MLDIYIYGKGPFTDGKLPVMCHIYYAANLTRCYRTFKMAHLVR